MKLDVAANSIIHLSLFLPCHNLTPQSVSCKAWQSCEPLQLCIYTIGAVIYSLDVLFITAGSGTSVFDQHPSNQCQFFPTARTAIKMSDITLLRSFDMVQNLKLTSDRDRTEQHVSGIFEYLVVVCSMVRQTSTRFERDPTTPRSRERVQHKQPFCRTRS